MGTPELAHNITLLGHPDQGGRGDGVQVMVGGGGAYVGHMFSDGVTVLDVRDPRNPRPVNYLPAAPGTWSLHLQLADGLLLVVNAMNMFAAEAFADESAYYGRSVGEVLAAHPLPARDRLVFATYQNAGVRVFDLANPFTPCSTSRARRDGAGVDPIWLVPPPGLVAAVAALPRPGPAGDPAGRLTAVLAAGAAGAYAWALDGPEAGRSLWGEQARLGLSGLAARLGDPGADTDRFALASQVSAVAQWAWLAGDRVAGHRADLVACELATGGWPGRRPLDRPDLVLLCDPTGRHALDHAGSRVRLDIIRDFPVAGPEGGGSWRRPGTVDRLLDHVSRQSHLGGPLLGVAARLLRTLVHPAVGPPWPPAAARDAQRRLATLASGDVDAWGFALPWLLDTATRFPARLAPLLRA